MAAAHGPLDHAVYLDRADPTRCLVLTRFESEQTAHAFMASGLHEEFRTRLLRCATDVGDFELYDLFYAADAGGGKVIYGEDA